MNVPKLRFKEFNDDYRQFYLRDITELIKDGTHGTHKEAINGIPLLSAKDIFDNKINIPLNARKISEEDFNKIYSNYKLNENDILITIVGTIGRTAIYKNEKIAFQRSVATIRVKESAPNYIRAYLESSKVSNQLSNMTNSSAQGGIYLNSLSKIKLHLPSIKEQTKIANFLSLLDKKIELQTKKIEDLKLYKLYTTSIIFNSNVILNSKEYELKDILISGSKIPVKDTNLYKKMNIKLNHKGLEINESKREMMDTRPFYIRKEKEIIIGKQNYFNGSIAMVNSRFHNCICSNAIMSFSVKKEYDTDYVYNYISQDGYIKRRAFLANGTGQKELSEKEFLKFTIKVPNKDFQEKTSFIINKFNNKIDLENLKLEELKKLKKGLIQNMFV